MYSMWYLAQVLVKQKDAFAGKIKKWRYPSARLKAAASRAMIVMLTIGHSPLWKLGCRCILRLSLQSLGDLTPLSVQSGQK